MRDYDELVKRLKESDDNCVAEHNECPAECESPSYTIFLEAADAIEELLKRPKIPETGIGDLSDGYHTFNGLYYQRMILFAALVRTYKDRAWKSFHHEDGELCFGGGWFIVGIDTPEGSYTYHYENKDFDKFDCIELPRGKHWDGHTEEDVIRLLSLPEPPKEVRDA